MAVLDNHIYYSICEKTFEEYKKSHFPTYRNFSRDVKSELHSQNYSPSTLLMLTRVVKYIDFIYCLGESKCWDYIIDFYAEEQYAVFEKSVRAMKELFNVG